MALTANQIKGRIKNIAKTTRADARILIRIYMMERLLERISVSKYSDNFVIKGGILITSMVGVNIRSTMDIDTSLKNVNLSEEQVNAIFEEICNIDLQDEVDFYIKGSSDIMDEMEYPGIRISMEAKLEGMIVPLKIDISTGDVITPREIKYDYKLMLEDRNINLWTYNLETILGEKMQTILNRGILNTRMRDYYDIYILSMIYQNEIKASVLREAFKATCKKRNTEKLLSMGKEILNEVQKDPQLIKLWSRYKKKYSYASGITYSEVLDSVSKVYEIMAM